MAKPRKNKKRKPRKPRKKPMPSVPWNRRPAETNPAWLAFTTYRDMGPARTTAKVRTEIGRKPSYQRQLETWSSRHEWVARCEAFDAEMDRIAIEEHRKGIKDMVRRHLGLASSLQAAGALGLQSLIAKVKAAKPDEDILLSPNEIKGLVDLGTKLERQTRGEPEQIVEQRHGVADDGGKTRDALRGLLGVPAIADAAGNLASMAASYNGNGAAPERPQPQDDDEEDRDT